MLKFLINSNVGCCYDVIMAPEGFTIYLSSFDHTYFEILWSNLYNIEYQKIEKKFYYFENGVGGVMYYVCIFPARISKTQK